MTKHRTIMLIGGCADRQTVTLLHGENVIMDGANGRTIYNVVRLAGSTKRFEVGVPMDKDGDWLIERLLDGYVGRA